MPKCVKCKSMFEAQPYCPRCAGQGHMDGVVDVCGPDIRREVQLGRCSIPVVAVFDDDNENEETCDPYHMAMFRKSYANALRYLEVDDDYNTRLLCQYLWRKAMETAMHGGSASDDED